MKSTEKVTFDALPDMALIQIRALVNYKVVPYSATTIWRKCRAGEFPSPIKVSAGITAFRVGDIREYLVSIANTTKCCSMNQDKKHTLGISSLKVTNKELNKEFRTC